MKLLIAVSMFIVFISVIFILFIVTEITNRYLDCNRTEENKILCSFKNFSFSFIFSLIMIGIFAIIDCAVIYILIKTLVVRGSIGYISGM
jgi:hypothetical protein